jgi:hypothetical protein
MLLPRVVSTTSYSSQDLGLGLDYFGDSRFPPGFVFISCKNYLEKKA